MTIVVWGVVITWLLATVAANLPVLGSRVRRLDVLGIVPAWTFFAPNPGVTDPIVIVRDLLEDETWTPWRVVWRERPSGFRMWWRPGKRIAKLVSDCAGGIPRAHAGGDETLSASFLLIAMIARDDLHDWRATGFQFALIDVPAWWHGKRDAVTVYRSPLIGLGRTISHTR